MLIDFHTHIFPEKIAKGTMAILKKPMADYKGGSYEPHTDGTLEGLKKSMKENNIDISVVLPVVTSPKQTETINDFAKSVCSKEIFAFGGIFPGQEDFEDALWGIKERGLKGVKIHPEFQKCSVDSDNVVKIVKKAEDLGLYVVFHTGFSIGFEPPVHCTPEILRNLLKKTSGENIIAAHMGGWGMWNEVEKYIVKTPVMMDISFSRGYLEAPQFKRILENHGIEKFLYGSDSPWESQGDSLIFLEEAGLSEEEKDLIKYKNALRVLGISGKENLNV